MTPPQGRRLKIPAPQVREIRRLSDICNALPSGQNLAARYDLWHRIAEIFPEVRAGSWSLAFTDALSADVVETLGNK